MLKGAKKIWLLIFSFLPMLSIGQLSVDTGAASINHLVKNVLLGGNIKVRNIQYIGARSAIGYYKFESNDFDISRGIILSTGSVLSASGPNKSDKTGTSHYAPGDMSLYRILPIDNFDAATIEFDFLPQFESLTFRYVFASEEYEEFVGSDFNDIFGFFLSGPGIKGEKNIAKLPESDITVSINNINHLRNSEFYVSNEMTRRDRPGSEHNIEFDGFTKVLVAEADVTKGNWYHIKIVLADVRDLTLDSGVFIEAGSFQSYKGNNVNVISKGKFFYNIEFDVDSFTIKDGSKPMLNRVSHYLLRNSNMVITISGHTDNTGTEEYNMKLSELRAKTVAEYLKKRGVPESRITYKGYGSSKNIAPNNIERGRARNRRIEFVISDRW